MDKILNFIVEIIEKNDSTDEDEKEEIRYGLELILLKALFWCLVTATGIIMGCFRECIIFNLMFFLIRSNAGGYHAETRTRCLIQSVVTIVIALSVIKIGKENVYVMLFLSIIALFFGILIWKLAPVDTENRQLDNDEIKRFRNKVRIILIAEILVGIASYGLEFKTIACAAMTAIVTSGALVLAEYLKKSRHGGNYE